MSESYQRRRLDGREGLKPAFERLTDGVSTLVKQHMELARYEIKQDVQTTGKRMGVLAACGVIAVVGYIMLNIFGVVLAGALGGWTAAWITALALAVGNLAVAGGLATYFGRKLSEDKPVDLAQTNDEIDRDKKWLREIGEKARNGKTPKQLSQEEAPPS